MTSCGRQGSILWLEVAIIGNSSYKIQKHTLHIFSGDLKLNETF